ncbi:Rubber oxygenase [Paramyrothecium foliicola]|nr:Rubber oxygenase [Paramyrothecium foliicola]
MTEHPGQNTFRYAGHEFVWTESHFSKDETKHLRHEYDELGSRTVEKLQEIADKQNGTTRPIRGTIDLYTLLLGHHGEDKTLDEFWTEVHTVPEWVDWAQLERGQKYFYRYALANIVGFALQGFVGENTASPSVVEVLVRTGGFSVRTLRRRLLSTFQLILQVTDTIEAIRPGGAGHTTAIRVRLLHSAVRNRIMKLAKANPDYFNVEEFGIPVNSLDSIHSIATFCCNHMWLQLPQMGVYPRKDEMADYIALWRYVGYLLATEHQHFESPARAKATMESLLVNELHLTATSGIVLHNFVEFLTDLPPFNVSAQFIAAGSRRLNGDKFCDELGMDQPGWYARACFEGQCWLIRGLAIMQQHIPPFDRLMTKWFRSMLHDAVIHNKAGLSGGSKMSFKYVPQPDQFTTKETAPWHSQTMRFHHRPLEMFSFALFVFVRSFMVMVMWTLWQFGTSLCAQYLA